ncbi:unnamed protein product [Closterium sp. NIES-54]
MALDITAIAIAIAAFLQWEADDDAETDDLLSQLAMQMIDTDDNEGPSRQSQSAMSTETRARREARMAGWLCRIEEMTEAEFVALFRINRAIMGHLEAHMTDYFSQLTLRHQVPLRLCVLIPIKYLATGMSYLDMSIFFGVPQSVCHRIVECFLLAFPRRFKNDWVRFPSREEMVKMEAEFRATRGVPNVIGAVDGTHLPVRGIDEYRTEYYCRKQMYSVQLQLTVDARCRIWDYVVGWPGSAHDSRVFTNSALHTRIANGDIQPYQLLGDAAYPLKDYCLVPVLASKARLLTGWEQTFNYVQSATRMAVERTMGIFKNRWRIFASRHDSKLWRVCAGVGCAVVLHNMIEEQRECTKRARGWWRSYTSRRPNRWWERPGVQCFVWEPSPVRTRDAAVARRRHFGMHIHSAWLKRHEGRAVQTGSQ